MSRTNSHQEWPKLVHSVGQPEDPSLLGQRHGILRVAAAGGLIVKEEVYGLQSNPMTVEEIRALSDEIKESLRKEAD